MLRSLVGSEMCIRDSKYCEFTTQDVVATPFSALSNMVLCVLYAGFIILYRGDAICALSRCSPGWTADVYYLGVEAYFVGYGVFGVNSMLSWANRDYDGEYDPEDIKLLTFIGSILFLVGSGLLVWAATPPWGSKDYKPDCAAGWEELLLGPPRIWYGCFCFLVGSVLFVVASIHDRWNEPNESADTETRLWQAGILMFIPGRLFFLADAIYAIREGIEFRYGGSATYVDKVESAIAISLNLFKALRIASQRVELATQQNTCAIARAKQDAKVLGLPGGSWKRKAKRDGSGRLGEVSRTDEGAHVLTACLLDDQTGEYRQVEQMFEEFDTFTVVGGEFVKGCSAGLAFSTTRDVIDMCDLYDELDFSGTGMLGAIDVHRLTQALGQDATLEQIEKVVDDLDQDGGLLSDGKKGIDFPEFMMLTSVQVDPHKHRINLDKAWKKLDADGNGFTSKKEFVQLLSDLGMVASDHSEEEQSLLVRIVNQFFIMWDNDQEVETMSKLEFFNIVTGRAKPNAQVDAGRSESIPLIDLDPAGSAQKQEPNKVEAGYSTQEAAIGPADPLEFANSDEDGQM
eukprot:TRINITY_DN20216_c0_g1_i2.p1 TRINITY_DN20216_c0_g1~~TRINITY_DN20216_c0_g1_i2.p1  ORF type:complete len:613 (+),score=172.64 TRINITY_DN20216_c0_g1_i2:126-1841(+)